MKNRAVSARRSPPPACPQLRNDWDHQRTDDDIREFGKSIANDLVKIGIKSVTDLKGQEPGEII